MFAHIQPKPQVPAQAPLQARLQALPQARLQAPPHVPRQLVQYVKIAPATCTSNIQTSSPPSFRNITTARSKKDILRELRDTQAENKVLKGNIKGLEAVVTKYKNIVEQTRTELCDTQTENTELKEKIKELESGVTKYNNTVELAQTVSQTHTEYEINSVENNSIEQSYEVFQIVNQEQCFTGTDISNASVLTTNNTSQEINASSESHDTGDIQNIDQLQNENKAVTISDQVFIDEQGRTLSISDKVVIDEHGNGQLEKCLLTTNKHGKRARMKQTTWMCHQCVINFHNPADLTAHKLEKHQRTCDLCKKPFISWKLLETHMLQIHNVKVSPRELRCPTCDKFFDIEWRLIEHQRVHTKEKPFTCLHCGIKFRGRVGLKQHIQRRHGTQILQKEMCKICGIAVYGMKQHMRAHLSYSERAFPCDKCPSRFKTNCDLKTHLVKHTGEKSFKCQTCDMLFSYQRNLLRHEKIHLREVTKAPIQCNICHRVYKLKRALDKHKRFCTPSGYKDPRFTCEICHRKFKNNCILKNHMPSHTGETAFKCEKCPTKFRYKKCLTRHLENIHGMDKRRKHTCQKCKRFFYAERLLIEHVTKGCYISCGGCKKAFYTPEELAQHQMVCEHSYYKLDPSSSV